VEKSLVKHYCVLRGRPSEQGNSFAGGVLLLSRGIYFGKKDRGGDSLSVVKKKRLSDRDREEGIASWRVTRKKRKQEPGGERTFMGKTPL